jgi:hypothetical protein
MDIYQRQRQTIAKISIYLKKVLPTGYSPELDYLIWEFGTKEAVPSKFVTKAVEKILKFDFKDQFKIIEGLIEKND